MPCKYSASGDQQTQRQTEAPECIPVHGRVCIIYAGGQRRSIKLEAGLEEKSNGVARLGPRSQHTMQWRLVLPICEDLRHVLVDRFRWTLTVDWPFVRTLKTQRIREWSCSQVRHYIQHAKLA